MQKKEYALDIVRILNNSKHPTSELHKEVARLVRSNNKEHLAEAWETFVKPVQQRVWSEDPRPAYSNPDHGDNLTCSFEETFGEFTDGFASALLRLRTWRPSNYASGSPNDLGLQGVVPGIGVFFIH